MTVISSFVDLQIFSFVSDLVRKQVHMADKVITKRYTTNIQDISNTHHIVLRWNLDTERTR